MFSVILLKGPAGLGRRQQQFNQEFGCLTVDGRNSAVCPGGIPKND